jgi:hypothetical protein
MKSFIIAIILSLLTIPAFAQLGNETITITTYYPSPYGVYKNLELYPSDEPTVGVKEGVMYYNKTEGVIKIYNNTGAWVNLTGGSGSAYKDGDVMYNQTDKQLYAYNATNNNFTQIVVSGGGGVTITGTGESTVIVDHWVGMTPVYAYSHPHFDFMKDGKPFTFSSPPTITITDASHDEPWYNEASKCLMGRQPYQYGQNITTTGFDLVSYYIQYNCATAPTSGAISCVWSATGN